MSRRNGILALAALVVVGLAAGLIARIFFSGPPPGRMLVAGDVRPVIRTVSAPSIAYPTVTFSVKVLSNAAAGDATQTLTHTVVAGPQASATSSATAAIPTVSGRLSSVDVRVGDHVTTGTVLAQLDTATLDLGVAYAKVTAEQTKNTVKVLNNAIDTIISNQDKISTGWSKLATGKEKLASGAEQLATAKTQLLKAKTQLLKAQSGLLASQQQLLAAKKDRAQYETALAALKQQAATFPPGHVPPALSAKIAGLEKLLASIDPGLAKIDAGLAKVDAGLAQIDAGLAKVATGEAALQTGAAALSTAAGQLATASHALKTAKKQVVNARNVTRIIAQNADVPVEIAEAKRDQATIVSPVSGYVTQAATKGQVVIVGAPVVRIQQEARALVDTYVTPEQLTQVRLGSPADITYDSGGGRVLHATVAIIGEDAEYPPASFPTDVVHMTRTVKVTLRLDSGEAPPAGTPVDISIHTD